MPTNSQQSRNGPSANIENAMWYYSQCNILMGSSQFNQITDITTGIITDITNIIKVKTRNLR